MAAAHDNARGRSSAAAWLSGDGASTSSVNSFCFPQQHESGPAMVAAAVDAFAAAAGGTRPSSARSGRSTRSGTPTLRTARAGAGPVAAGAECIRMHTFERESSEDVYASVDAATGDNLQSEVDGLRIQLERARQEANEARRLSSENERLRSEVENLQCGASATAVNTELVRPQAAVSTLERQLSAARQESDNLRLQLFAAYQAADRERLRDHDGVQTPTASLPESAEGPASVAGGSTAGLSVGPSPVWEWMTAPDASVSQVGAGKADASVLLRQFQNASVQSLKAMTGLREQAGMMQLLLQKHQSPTVDAVSQVRQYVKALQHVNEQWSAIQLQHGGFREQGREDSPEKLPSNGVGPQAWAEVASQAWHAEIQARSLKSGVQVLQGQLVPIQG